MSKCRSRSKPFVLPECSVAVGEKETFAGVVNNAIAPVHLCKLVALSRRSLTLSC